MTLQQEFKIFLQSWKFDFVQFLQDFIQYNAEVNHYYSITGHERLMKRDSFSGYLSLGMNRKVFGPCGGSNLQVTSNAMLVQSLGPVFFTDFSPKLPTSFTRRSLHWCQVHILTHLEIKSSSQWCHVEEPVRVPQRTFQWSVLKARHSRWIG